MAPWHLALGALDELQLSIKREPDDRLALHFESLNEWAELPYLRIAMVQPGRHIELHPLHAPARSLPLPRSMAPLDDLWLLVRTATRRYWFEVPYGVCGSSEEQGGAAQSGPPRPPPGAMADDAVIPWRAIRFSLGRSDGCQLELSSASVRPGELELEARRHEPGPPPDFAVTASSGSLHLLEPWHPSSTEPDHSGQLHVARYAFTPDAEARSARSYLLLSVRAASSFELALPSSLTDPAHRSAARRLPPRFT
jgi:hypothetical protein